MFQIGLAPKVSKYKRKPTNWKTFKYPPLDEDYVVEIKFNPKPTSWLLLPESGLSYFEREMLREECVTSFANPYLKSISFNRKYPEGSIGYIFAKAAFPINMSYIDIMNSINRAYLKNTHVRLCMKKLCVAWKRKHMNMVNDVDLVTQEVPKKPVLIFNWQTKTTYQFEATTILRDSFIRLMNHDLMILEPLKPRNPFTNSELTYAECLSVHEQLLKAGVTNWLWEAYAESDFVIKKLLKNFQVPMKLYCIDLILKNNNDVDTLEFIMDFILGEYIHHKVINPPSDITILLLIKQQWHSSIMQSWISTCRTFWRGYICSCQEELIYAHIKSRELIGKTKLLTINNINIYINNTYNDINTEALV